MMVREAEPDDLPELLRMARSFHAKAPCADMIPFDPRSMADTFERLAVADTGVLLVAEHEGKVCGMIGGAAIPHWVNAGHLVAQEMFWWVDESARGTRAGFMLMKALEEWARTIGVRTLFMASTTNDNAESLAKLYHRRGFAPQDVFYAKNLGE